MAWTSWKGFNLRSTAGYVTDGTDEVPVRGSSTAYPTTTSIGGDSVTYGWEDTASILTVDRNNGIDVRLAGINYVGAGSSNQRFRIDLPATGDYEIRLAAGDAGAGNRAFYEIQDSTTAFITQADTGISSAQWYDAGGNLRTSAASWASDNVAVTRTFASTICRLLLKTSGSGASVFSHIAVRSVSGGGSSILRQMMQLQG